MRIPGRALSPVISARRQAVLLAVSAEAYGCPLVRFRRSSLETERMILYDIFDDAVVVYRNQKGNLIFGTAREPTSEASEYDSLTVLSLNKESARSLARWVLEVPARGKKGYMPNCECCWSEAKRRKRPGESLGEVYNRVYTEHESKLCVCTRHGLNGDKARAGQFWDGEKDSRLEDKK